MNLPFYIARRYLFAKKSTNAINIISGITAFGISIGTAALILVLSVFNGFEDLLTGLFSPFNPDVKVLPLEGKLFVPDTIKLAEIVDLKGVDFVSQTLEEIAMFEHKKNQDIGILKGVDTFYQQTTAIDSTLREGHFLLEKNGINFALLGVNMRNKLSVNIDNDFSSIKVYILKHKKTGPLSKPFRTGIIHPAATFSIQQDVDNQYILSSLAFARKVMGYKKEISNLEIKLNGNVDAEETIIAIRNILGDKFVVKDRYQQDEAFLKLINVEKWMSYAILSLTLILVAFNMVGALWMIVLDKKNDVAILKSMGAENQLIRRIFLHEGLLLCGSGMFLGFFIAILLYVIQKSYGIVPIPVGFVIDSYPISMQAFDFVVVGITVVSIGFLASVPAAMKAARITTFIREE